MLRSWQLLCFDEFNFSVRMVSLIHYCVDFEWFWVICQFLTLSYRHCGMWLRARENMFSRAKDCIRADCFRALSLAGCPVCSYVCWYHARMLWAKNCVRAVFVRALLLAGGLVVSGVCWYLASRLWLKARWAKRRLALQVECISRGSFRQRAIFGWIVYGHRSWHIYSVKIVLVVAVCRCWWYTLLMVDIRFEW